MSLIEQALKRALESGDLTSRPTVTHTHTSSRRPRQGMSPAPPIDAAQVRRFQRATLDEVELERNCVLLKVADSAAARAYKILRTRVAQRLQAKQWRSIAVTGAGAGEGKTMTSINLAIALAQDVNTCVFLVDLDLHRPKLADTLGMHFDACLSDYLAGNAKVDDVLYDIGVDRLAVLPNRSANPHSSEELSNVRMQELVKSLEAEEPRRIIIYDMPPILMSDDVIAFTPMVDSVLMVIAEGQTPRATLEKAKEALEDMNLLGIVFNRSSERNDSPYY
jgi:protein-tyrosine kinase